MPCRLEHLGKHGRAVDAFRSAGPAPLPVDGLQFLVATRSSKSTPEPGARLDLLKPKRESRKHERTKARKHYSSNAVLPLDYCRVVFVLSFFRVFVIPFLGGSSRGGRRPLRQERFELRQAGPASLETLAIDVVVAEEHVFEGHQRLADQLAKHLRLPDLAQVLPVRFSLGQANDLPPVELHELMAEQVDHGGGIVSRLVETAGLIEQGKVRLGQRGRAGPRSAGLRRSPAVRRGWRSTTCAAARPARS